MRYVAVAARADSELGEFMKRPLGLSSDGCDSVSGEGSRSDEVSDGASSYEMSGSMLLSGAEAVREALSIG